MEAASKYLRWVVPLVVLAVFVPTLWALALVHSGASPNQPAANGIDFSRAIDIANSLVSNSSGAPWSLISGLGVATPLPLLPLTSEFPPGACQGLPGVSIWNASRLSVWNGSLSSGTAPFWSFLYLNSSRYVEPVEVVNTTASLQPPIAPSSECGLAIRASISNALPINVTVDSPVASLAAWKSVGQSLENSVGAIVVYYIVGADQLANTFSSGGPSWSITYTHCGVQGYANLQPFAVAIVNGSSGIVTEHGNGSVDCSLGNYTLLFGAPTSTTATNGTMVTTPVSVISPLPNGTNILDAAGLVSWMTSLELSGGSGVLEPVGQVACGGGMFGPTSCKVLNNGWYAAIATSSGTWLDLFSNESRGPAWMLPNVPIYSNDSVLVFLPSSIAGLPLQLSVVSTTSSVEIAGNLIP